MLTEEAHHMFVGDSGISRVIRRTCEVMRELRQRRSRARARGRRHRPADDAALHQFLVHLSLDLFGAEVSSNAASYFAAGVKGRPDEKRFQDHVCRDGTLTIDTPQGRKMCHCATP